MRTIRLVVEYDGTAFHGWQRQPEGVRTVQGTLEERLHELLGTPANITGASRTDAGVHALGQVAAFSTPSPIPPDRIPQALNAILPSDVAVRHADEVRSGWNPRFEATGKVYRYHLALGRVRGAFADRYAWHCTHDLDLDLMRAGARGLLGEHDFRCFERAADPTEPSVRNVRSVLVEPLERPLGLAAPELTAAPSPPIIAIEVAGDAFVWNMVRSIAGTLVEVGRGKLPPDEVGRIVAEVDRSRAGPTLPARGLVLVRVEYDGERRPRRGRRPSTSPSESEESQP